MASRPTPSPKSVVMLLKQQERKEVEASDQNTLLPPQNFNEEEDDNFGNDENVFNREEMEENKKIREVWDKKAKIRFNEAVKEERRNKENAEILKEIQNAEQVNRHHMAKTISAKGGNIPCQPPYNLFHSSKQVAMENKVERIFEQNPKEHAVEDLEGYEDRFEAKYREIDSNLEARLIDCIPSFMKENYNYLLEDESTLLCGRRFTVFQNEDPLNMGFIASPPSTEELERSVTKVEFMDKAVEANILRRPTEHKSIEVNTSDADHVHFEPGSLDLMNRGVMNFKRKPLSEFPGSARTRFLSPPRVDQELGKTSGRESWSSSSYWSLPSKHGMPKTCNLCDSPTCRIPLVEHEKSPLTCIPLSENKATSDPEYSVMEESINPVGSQQASSRSVSSENKLSHYVKMVAEKYLKSPKDTQMESLHTEKNKSESEIEREVFFSTDPTGNRNSFKFDYAEEGFREMLPEENTITDSDGHITSKSNRPKSPSHPAEAPLTINMDASAEDSFLQKCDEVISENLWDLFQHGEPPAEDGYSSGKVQTYSSPFHPRQIVYHELSTIQEMDSVLTNDSNHTKSSWEHHSVSVERRSSSRSEGKADLSIDTTPISLIEDPPEEVSKLAKSIKFTEKKSPFKSMAGQNEMVVHDSPNLTSTDESQPSSQASDRSVVSAVSSLASKFSNLLSIQRGSLSSCGPLAPSTISAQPSPVSVGSPGVLYAASSPFKGPPGILIPLPKYFQDLSSIQKGSSSSASFVSGASEEKSQARFPIKLEEKQLCQGSYGLGSFAPMSPQSGFSSPGEERFYNLPQDKSSIQNQACIVSSKGTTTSQSIHFQAMTPLSHDLSAEDEISVPKSESVWSKEQPKKVPSHISLHTYLPSLTESSNSSKAATPSQREFKPRETNESLAPELTSPSDFYLQRKKPTSILKSQAINSISSPSKSSPSSLQSNLSLSEVKSFLKQSISSDIVLPTSRGMCQPVDIKPNIQTTAVNVSHLPDSGKGNVLESTKRGYVMRNDVCSPFTPNRIDSNCKMAAKDVGSRSFLSTLTAKDCFGIPSESTEEGQIETPTLKPLTPSQVILRNDYLDTVCANGESPLSRNKIEFSETTPDFPRFPSSPLLQVLKNNDPTRSPGQLSSQQGTPCRSIYQTPSKTLEEMMMETGIMNEPEPTLFELTVNPGSPEKQWRPANNQSFSVQSPSMLSFLQHEQSCLLAAEPTDERQEMTQNQLQEKIKASPRSAKKRNPGNEYKSRTKRLWNNLEEVKERKMLKEKREELLKNRKKMMEYSKKLPTPKK